MIEKLDEDFVKALRFFSGIFSFRFEILFAVVWSFFLFLHFFLQCKFAMRTSIAIKCMMYLFMNSYILRLKYHMALFLFFMKVPYDS